MFMLRNGHGSSAPYASNWNGIYAGSVVANDNDFQLLLFFKIGIYSEDWYWWRV